nr:reverse transcriptase domain-containing protein [Tanacetum cinerariifolium]
MHTRSSSNLPLKSPPNRSSSNPKRRNRRRSKQHFILEESPIDTMADQRTMAELLRAPTEGYTKAIVVPPILAEQFELKHNLINMMTSDQFFGLEKDNPHDHIRWFNKITSTIKYKDVPNSAIKLMLFPLSLAGAAHRWLKKEPPRSILTWEDLVSKFINEFFPPQEQQISVMKFQSFNNDSLNSAAGGNLLERRTQDVLTIIENKYKVRNSQNNSVVSQVKSSDANSNSSFEIAKLTHAVNQQTNVVATAMTAILKQFQATPPTASVKAVEEICVTCGGAHQYYQCIVAGGNTFLELRDNIQGYVTATAVNYNQSNFVYRPPGMANQIRPSGFAQPNVQNNQNRFSQPQGYNRGNNFNLEQSYQAPTQQNQVVPLRSGSIPSNTIANPKGELKVITTRSGIVLDGPFVPIPPQFINPEEDKRVEETLTDQDLAEYTIKVSPPLVQKSKPSSQRNFTVHQRDPLYQNIPYSLRMLKQKLQEKDEVQIHKFWQMFKQLHINITLADALILIPKYQKMLKALLSNKEKLQELANTPLNENCSAVILKKLPKKIGDPGKFLIPCDFNELKCKALADLGASINLMPLSIWKKLANFVIVYYESDPRVPLILGRPFLRTARALIDVHREEMILRDGDKRLTLNMRHDTTSYSNQPQKESINLINVFNDSNAYFLEDLFSTNQPKEGNVLPEKLLNLDSTKDLHPPHHVNPLSGSTTSSSSPNQLLEEFADELTLITFPPGNDDLQFEIESLLKEIEYLLHHDLIKDIDSILKDLIDKSNLANLNDNLVDSMPEMFTDEHTVDYSSSPLYDEHDDYIFKVESDTENVYDDPFDSKGEEIKESKLLIDELDLPSDFLPPFEYDLFFSEDFFEVDALPSTNNEDKEDFDPPLYELPFFKEVPRSNILLPFSSKNEEKVFKQGIHISEKVHSSLITELSHQGYNVFKINQILKSFIKIFLFSGGKDTHISAVPCLYFYPLDQL